MAGFGAVAYLPQVWLISCDKGQTLAPPGLRLNNTAHYLDPITND